MLREELALLGGSFDPLHNGHLALIEFLGETFKKLLLVPCGSRKDKKLSDEKTRLDMVRVALKSLKNPDSVVLQEIEVREGWRCSRDLLRQMNEKYFPGREEKIRFVIGSDLLGTLPKWLHYDLLSQENNFAVISRQGYSIAETPPELQGKLVHLKCDLPEVSSTEVKRLIGEGDGRWRELVPEGVREMIQERGLYRV